MGAGAVDHIHTPERDGRPAPRELRDRRELANQHVGEAGPGVEVVDEVIVGVPCRVVGVPAPTATVIYLHGGGFRLGSAAGWTTLAGRIARTAGARIVLVDYRLAPEHPYPAALIDATSVYDEIVATVSHPVVVAGDSAGGGLAAGVASAAVRGEGPVPGALILMSAWLDLRGESTTYVMCADTDQYFTPTQARIARDLYLQQHPADDDLASPLLGVTTGHPRTLMFASTDEILLGDSLDMARRLAEVGTSVSLEVAAGLPHAWPSVAPDHEATQTVVSRIGELIRDISRDAVPG